MKLYRSVFRRRVDEDRAKSQIPGKDGESSENRPLCNLRSAAPARPVRRGEIKLDKCGGFTEALALANEARRLRFEIMAGNMCGTSLAMAPAFLVAQGARWADLDGPLLNRASAITQ